MSDVKKTNRSKVTPLVEHFPDKEKVFEILEEWPPRKIRNFNKFMKENKARIVLELCSDESTVVNQRIGQTIVRLFHESKNLTRKGWKENDFLRCASKIIESDSIDEFEKLDKDVQHQVWNTFYSVGTYNEMQPCTDKAYLRLLHRTGLSVDHADKVQYKLADRDESVLPFQRALEEKYGIDLSNPTPGFLNRVMKFPKVAQDSPKVYRAFHDRIRSLDPYGVQIILMFRAIYGEDKIIDFFKHFINYEQSFCPDEMIDLLDNWEELRVYSVDWISQIQELEHANV